MSYVNIETLSDAWGWKGLWPDPLPDYYEPFDAKGGENTPLWFTIMDPKNWTRKRDWLRCKIKA